MVTRIKICGVRDPETARVAVAAGASFVGLVFAEASPRLVTIDEAKKIVAAVRSASAAAPGGAEPVALFVERPVEEIVATCRAIGVTIVQLHGRESPEMVARLRPLRVVKATASATNDWLAALEAWRPLANELAGILCDAAPPPGAARSFRGGHGQAFDWSSLARARDAGVLHGLPPLFLAGGLTTENVAQAIAIVRPDVVDVSSGVESARGVKDYAKVRAFCAAAQAARSH